MDSPAEHHHTDWLLPDLGMDVEANVFDECPQEREEEEKERAEGNEEGKKSEWEVEKGDRK